MNSFKKKEKKDKNGKKNYRCRQRRSWMQIQLYRVWKGLVPRFPTHHRPYRYHTHSLLYPRRNTHVFTKNTFLSCFSTWKNFPKTTFSKYFEFSSDMSIPARPMELRKKFHRLTHIYSIRPQWNFCNDSFSYVRMIHFKPWKPIFHCKFKKHIF